MRHALSALSAASVLALSAAGCGSAAVPASHTAAGVAPNGAAASDTGVATSGNPGGAWIGAAPESDVLLSADDDATVGIWVDAPRVKPRVRTPVDLALVIDTSGSMEGAKLDNARQAARMLVDDLADGDIVSIDTFDDEAKPLVAPTRLDARSRAQLLSTIAELHVGGSTNLFDGLALGEAHVARAPATHAVRRVVVLSDGNANVGPSTPEALGQLAERGLRFHAQVTSVGVGTDYDEKTLNALAMRSTGRLYHVSDPSEMTSMLKHELDLLESTVANDAFVEVVPADGVTITGADGARWERTSDGATKIPLGALFGGQHREALVRVRFTGGPDSPAARGDVRPIASVRLHYKDPNEGDLERVQETIARASFTSDETQVAAHANAKTQAIMAVMDAAKLQIEAAQEVNQGRFDGADHQLAQAQKKLEEQAATTKDDTERRRLTAAAHSVGSARATTAAVAAAPAPAKRDQALKLNKSGMSDMGF